MSRNQNFKKRPAPSQTFWRESFMKVLSCLYWEEATWGANEWDKYGVSEADRKRIEQEFDRHLRNSKKPVKST